MFENPGDLGMFFIGVVLGYLLVYWVRHNDVEGKGLAAVLGVIVGVTAWAGFYAYTSLDEYGLGLFVGLGLNLVLRVVGETIGIPDLAYRFPSRSPFNF